MMDSANSSGPTTHAARQSAADAPKFIFSSAYLGSVRYYAAMLRSGNVAVDLDEPVHHHSWIHNHCRIIGANGVQSLAVPVEKPASWQNYCVKDMRISEHGDWRRVHWGAIFSAYGKTPFFEYIATELNSIYEQNSPWLYDFNAALHSLVIDFLDLPIVTSHSELKTPSDGTRDFRSIIGSKVESPEIVSLFPDREYHQIWSPKFGFIPNMSILDLLMNTGRESIFTLLAMSGQAPKAQE